MRYTATNVDMLTLYTVGPLLTHTTKAPLGPEHVAVASVHGSLGSLCETEGDYKAARQHYEQQLLGTDLHD